MKRHHRILWSVLLFIGLLWVWPNLIHEPLHCLAANAQGISCSISYDWGLPPHPTTTREGQVTSILGGLLFLLLPSLISVVAMLGLWFVKTWWAAATTVYLGMDLIINIWKFTASFSDWRMLQAVPFGRLIAGVCCAVLMLWMAVKVSKEVIHEETERTEESAAHREGVRHTVDRRAEGE